MNQNRLNKLPKWIVSTYGFLKEIRIPAKLVFIMVSVLATLWFFVRVIPKPTRATYPCIQVAAPVMSSFFIWIFSVTASWYTFRKAKNKYLNAKYLSAALLAIVGLVFSVSVITSNPVDASAEVSLEPWHQANQPIGEARGVNPGRVVWAHAPGAATWDGKTGYWWDDKNTDQTKVNSLIKESITLLTGETDENKAWDALFLHFNKTKQQTENGYRQGEKIAIKINQNNTENHTSNNNINGSPQLILALLNSLIEEAGVPQSCITVFDASRFIGDNIYNKCHSVYPEVKFVDNSGGDGRLKSEYVEKAIPYSVDNKALAQGLTTCVTEADYVINMALLKGHQGPGVTLCAKNFYGSTSIYSDWKKNAHNNFIQNREGKFTYLTYVDFMGHKDLGEKTLLFMIDALYSQKIQNGIPQFKWQMPPFNNSWPSSLFVSQDMVAIDAVGMDFILNEWPNSPKAKYCDAYLIEAAQANNPPSGTVYDPEQDGTTLGSLGVMEHWNNAIDKQYSRNLDEKNGTGIELIYSNTNN